MARRPTHCAREEVRFAGDSPLEQRGFELAVPPRPARGATTFELHPGNAQETSGVEQVQLCRFLFQMGLRVRIPLPPAVSLRIIGLSA